VPRAPHHVDCMKIFVLIVVCCSATQNHHRVEPSKIPHSKIDAMLPTWLKSVAIAFHGHYLRQDALFHTHSVGCSNFFNDAENMTLSIVSPLEHANITVKTFFSTVGHCPESDERLVQYIRPTAYSFAKCMLPRIVDSYIEVLDLVASHSPPVDAVILTRFDLLYRKPIFSMGVSWKSVNFPFADSPVYWSREKKVSDLFHVLPFHRIAAFRAALDASGKRSHTAGHHAYSPLVRVVGSEAINFIDSSRGRGSNVRADDPDPTFLFIDRSCEGYLDQCPKRPKSVAAVGLDEQGLTCGRAGSLKSISTRGVRQRRGHSRIA
jgi:hypothetical protein